uniref:F-box domain-containing protein n=2 Tax=Mesocestoides corti TaxID=53468 RepID=A0A5K3FFJ9_MESCO
SEALLRFRLGREGCLSFRNLSCWLPIFCDIYCRISMKRDISFLKQSEPSERSIKLRRSLSTETAPLKCQDSFFNFFPSEIVYHIFSFLEIPDLSNVSLTSRAGRMSVELYLSSSSCTQLRDFRKPHPPFVPNTFGDVKRKIKYYSQIGTLFRRVFCFLPLSLRIQLLDNILQAHLCHSGFEPKSASNSKGKRVVDPSKTFLIKGACIMGRLRCPSTFYFGHFLRSFLLGCTQNEYQRVFHALVHACFVQNFWLRLTNLLCKRPDESPEDELAIRLFLRRIFLDPQSLPLSINPSWADLSGTQNPTSSTQSDSNHSNSSDLLTSSGYVSSTTISFPGDCSLDSLNFLSPDGTSDALITSTPLVKASGSGTSSATSADDNSSVWPTVRILANILRSYPFVHQARILFILYGPVHKGRLMWNIMCENTAADLKQLSACFGELGRVLNSLWLSGYWSANDTLAVFHEITNTPDGWLAENVACLLHSAEVPSWRL